MSNEGVSEGHGTSLIPFGVFGREASQWQGRMKTSLEAAVVAQGPSFMLPIAPVALINISMVSWREDSTGGVDIAMHIARLRWRVPVSRLVFQRQACPEKRQQDEDSTMHDIDRSMRCIPSTRRQAGTAC